MDLWLTYWLGFFLLYLFMLLRITPEIEKEEPNASATTMFVSYIIICGFWPMVVPYIILNLLVKAFSK